MALARTDDGIEVQWTSSSAPVEQLDAALNRDRNLTIRYSERLLAELNRGAYELAEADEQDVFRRAPITTDL